MKEADADVSVCTKTKRMDMGSSKGFAGGSGEVAVTWMPMKIMRENVALMRIATQSSIVTFPPLLFRKVCVAGKAHTLMVFGSGADS